jgi:uncharacterized protein (UPF0332 family)
MSAAARKEVIQYWWAKPEESLRPARREFEAGSYLFAVNRTYYAAFYGVSAGLLDKDQSFRKHSGVRAAFHREFIKPGRLGVEWARFYDRLYEDRQEGDYVALASFDREYVAAQLDHCSRFLAELRPLISHLSSG